MLLLLAALFAAAAASVARRTAVCVCLSAMPGYAAWRISECGVKV